ncbi:MAG TPA: enoyl-CoA hydratase-related protein [Candidatus Limnocylindria bacterium]|nr:enoyl-CoA hydratase-related protein [Candidatus Limnocylindria bacterium]
MTVTSPPTVHVRTEDGVATVLLDRPPLNVLTIAMLNELESALRDLGAVPDLRLIVIRGAGRVFSAGVDVGEHVGDALEPMLDAFARVSRRLLETPVPTLAVIHGAALGGACEIAAVCDLAVTTDDAKLGTPEIALGVVPPVGAAMFPLLVGPQRARALVLLGEPVRGTEAAAIGLVWKSVAPDALDGEVTRIVERFRSLSGASLRLAKRTFRVAELARTPVEAVMAADAEQRRSLPRMHDANEGLRAFLEKRAPRWLHR